jgi:hypothetical protein
MNDSKKKTRRERAAVNLLSVYAQLERYERNLFKELLLQHVSPYQVPYSYWLSGKIVRRVCWLQLSEHVCPHVADAWRNWASEIAKEDPCDDTVRVVILALLWELISMFPEESFPPATGCKAR